MLQYYCHDFLQSELPRILCSGTNLSLKLQKHTNKMIYFLCSVIIISLINQQQSSIKAHLEYNKISIIQKLYPFTEKKERI